MKQLWRIVESALPVSRVICFVRMVAVLSSAGERSDQFPGLTVPVFACDQWREFVVDTGADYCFVHPALTNHLTPARSRSIGLEDGTSRDLSFFQGPAMFISNVWMAAEVVGCPGVSPFTVWEERGGGKVDGVLGLDLLTNFCLLLDFTKPSITLSTNLPYPLRCGLPLNLAANGKFVFLASLAEHETIEMALDTGCEGSVALNPDDWNKAFPKGPANWHLLTISDALGDTFETLEARLPILRIGSEVFTNVECTRSYNADIPSVVGLKLLRGHRVMIDYPDRIINVRAVPTK